MSVEGNASSTYELRGKLSGVFSNIIDNTLTIEGASADAKATGDAIKGHAEDKNNPHGVTAAQVGARPDTWMPNALQVGAVPNTRKVNNKALSADITLSAADVGAAPSGYGLGEDVQKIDLDTVTKSGNYKGLINLAGSLGTATCWCKADMASENYGTMTAHSELRGGFSLKRTKDNGAWGVWEYVNPPMEVGIAYRTTKRHNGKPVYKGLFDLGQLADGSTSATGVVKYKTLNLTNATPIHLEWLVKNTSGNQFLYVPFVDSNGKVQVDSRIIYDSTKISVYAICLANCTGYNAQFILEYTID